MADMKLFLDESETLDFDISIESDASNVGQNSLEVWFTINENGFKYSLEAQRDGNKYTVFVPKMSGLLSQGEKVCMIEVFCNGRHFVPWKEDVVFSESVKVKAKVMKERREIETKDVKVTMRKRTAVRKPTRKIESKNPISGRSLKIKTRKGTMKIGE